jgi:hypothetical protein
VHDGLIFRVERVKPFLSVLLANNKNKTIKITNILLLYRYYYYYCRDIIG